MRARHAASRAQGVVASLLKTNDPPQPIPQSLSRRRPPFCPADAMRGAELHRVRGILGRRLRAARGAAAAGQRHTVAAGASSQPAACFLPASQIKFFGRGELRLPVCVPPSALAGQACCLCQQAPTPVYPPLPLPPRLPLAAPLSPTHPSNPTDTANHQPYLVSPPCFCPPSSSSVASPSPLLNLPRWSTPDAEHCRRHPFPRTQPLSLLCGGALEHQCNST